MATPRYIVKRIGNDYKVVRADTEGVVLSSLATLGGGLLVINGLRGGFINKVLAIAGGGIVYYALSGNNPITQIQQLINGGGGNDDWQGAMQHAREHGGNSGDDSMFGNVISHLQGNSGRIQQESNIDEGQFVQAHQNLYGGGGGGQQHSAQTMGMGAAMQALKMFSGGGDGQSSGLGGGPGQNQFVGMAMGQASKLFDQQNSQGNVQDGADKESVVKEAGEMALKMYMKSQMGGGGPAGLMSMASKFL